MAKHAVRQCGVHSQCTLSFDPVKLLRQVVGATHELRSLRLSCCSWKHVGRGTRSPARFVHAKHSARVLRSLGTGRLGSHADVTGRGGRGERTRVDSQHIDESYHSQSAVPEPQDELRRLVPPGKHCSSAHTVRWRPQSFFKSKRTHVPEKRCALPAAWHRYSGQTHPRRRRCVKTAMGARRRTKLTRNLEHTKNTVDGVERPLFFFCLLAFRVPFGPTHPLLGMR